jgi:hypothetical protein
LEVIVGQSARGNFAALLDIANVKEDTSIAEGFLVFFGVGNGYFVNFD